MLSSSSSSEGGSNNTTDQTNNNNYLVSMTNNPERDQQAVRNSLQNYVKKARPQVNQLLNDFNPYLDVNTTEN